jgi:hypothetical protein
MSEQEVDGKDGPCLALIIYIEILQAIRKWYSTFPEICQSVKLMYGPIELVPNCVSAQVWGTF